MKLRNKKTGEIIDLEVGRITDSGYGSAILLSPVAAINESYTYPSLAELNEEWEDYEEPKEYWFIDFNGEIKEFEVLDFEWQGWIKEIGNYFATKEEAEKAVEKLKAWKRLKDKGFRILGYYHRLGETKSKGEIGFEMNGYAGTKQDLDLLFGGEE